MRIQFKFNAFYTKITQTTTSSNDPHPTLSSVVSSLKVLRNVKIRNRIAFNLFHAFVLILIKA
jgi:hypothetical protein